MVFQLSSYTDLYDILHFLQFLRSKILRITSNDRRNLENFYFFSFFKKLTEIYHHKKSKIHKNLKKIFITLPNMVGQWKKIDF